ncbi:AMP-binding protein [Lysinibacillus sp. FJAT-14745]|uniref:AMP-binding protein n=1 Tax=Lysinibacillus sp. FJAT-14745 TaxID=1704289 RepID=UPI000A6DA51F|nr:AMP-binding protein [Lysinibacillus sp. FJAT-14745]
MNVGYLVNRVESRIQTISPEKIALKLESNETWTYGDLNRISNQYAHSLQQMGIVKGDRVGILLYNCLEYFALYFATAKLGAIAVRINFRLSSEEFKYILNDSGTKILCLHSSLQDKIELIKSSIKVREYVCLENENITSANWTNSWDVLEKGSPSEVIGIDIDKSDPVMLMYTSGTTGRPKGRFGHMKIRYGLQICKYSNGELMNNLSQCQRDLFIMLERWKIFRYPF